MDNWSTKGIATWLILGVVAPSLLAYAAMYLAGVLFLALNGIDTARAGVTSIVNYWILNAGEPRQRELLGVAIGTSTIAAFVVLLAGWAAVFVPWRRLRVEARFASAAEIKHAGLVDPQGEPGILVGSYRNRCLTLREREPVMLFDPSSSRNEVGMVVNNLLDFPDSVVVLDVDGRNFDLTAGYRASHQPVFAFSPFDGDARSHCWNPLSAVRNGKEHREADLLVIAEAFFPSAGQETSDAFYFKLARDLFVRLGLMLFESPAMPRTIGEMLRQVSYPQLHLYKFARRRSEEDKPLSVEEANTLAREVLNPHSVWAHTIATFKEALSIFSQTSVDAATSGDDFRLEDVRRKRMSIYIRIPATHLSSASPLLNLIFSQLVELNTRQTRSHDQTLKCQCLVVNQVFTEVGRLDAIASKADVLGDYDLRLLTVVPSMSQLEVVYGWEGARKLSADHAACILYAPPSFDDAEDCSVMQGYRSQGVKPGGWIRSLYKYLRTFLSGQQGGPRRTWLLPHEVEKLGNEVLLLAVPSCRLVLGRKIWCQSDLGLQKRLQSPPLVPRLDMLRHMTRTHRRVCEAKSPGSKETPVVKTSDSPLVRDLGGIASRLEESLDDSETLRTDRQAVEHDALTRTDAARGS